MTWLSDQIRELAQQGPGFTLAVMTALLVLGFVTLILGRRREHLPELGIGLIVGGLFAFASYTNQVTVEINSFRSTLAVSQDLSGFEPNGQDLSGLNFASKKLQAANLREADLIDANLSYANLREARLRGAQLRNASLFYATALRADLIRTDLRDADLRGAKITTPAIYGAKLTGARVHGSTCWNIPLSDPRNAIPDEQGESVLKTVVEGGLEPDDGVTLGRICYKSEVGESMWPKAPAAGVPINVCVHEPHLMRESCAGE